MHNAKEGVMGQSMTTLTNSNYYSAALNAAIFDGPFRIYFSQTQESEALSIYFRLQKELSATYERAKAVAPRLGQNLFLMLYPTEETLVTCFDNHDFVEPVAVGMLKTDFVFGFHSGITDDQVNVLFQKIQRQVDQWIIDLESLPATEDLDSLEWEESTN